MRAAAIAIAAAAIAGCGGRAPRADPVAGCQREWRADVAWARAHTAGTMRILQAAQRRYTARANPRCSLTGG